MRMKLLNSVEDIAWLETTHLKNYKEVHGRFNSFVLFGNEDWPDRVELYKRKEPTINSKIFKAFVMNADGDLI
jgi:hypothetical protein